MKRYGLFSAKLFFDPVDTMEKHPKGEWVKYDDVKPILELSKDFGFIHIGDGDELGIMARKLLRLMGEIK